MNAYEIIEWLEHLSAAAEKEGRRIAAKTLADTANELRWEIKRRNADNIAALDRKQI
jgi:hypothetical protein